MSCTGLCLGTGTTSASFHEGGGDDLRDKMNLEYLLSALPVNLHFLSIPTRDAIRTMRFASVQFHQFLINRLVLYNKRSWVVELRC